MTDGEYIPRKYAVAFSFASEHRAYVKEVSEALKDQLKKAQLKVFYYRDFEMPLSGKDLEDKLRIIYMNESELIAVLICSKYPGRHWCKLEWDTIGPLLLNHDKKRVKFCSLER